MIVAIPLTDGPAVIGTSIQVAPLSSEYWSLVTATSSVAASMSFTGPRYHGLRMPVKADGSSVAAARAGAVVSGACAPAGAAAANAAAAAANATARLETALIYFLLADAPAIQPGTRSTTLYHLSDV